MGVVATPAITPAVVKQATVERLGILPGVLTTSKGASPVAFSIVSERKYFEPW